MSTATPTRPGLSRTVSSMRLAVAKRGMDRAERLQDVIDIKNKTKALGLLPADLDSLRAEFTRAVARFRQP